MPRPSAHLRLVAAPSPATAGTTGAEVDVTARASREADLVRGLVARDPSTCDRVYRLYQRPVWRMLRRVMGNDAELADLHHEVFLQVLQSAPRFRGESRLETWILAIAINCARGRLRSRARKKWLTFVAPEDLPEPPPATTEAAARARAVYAIVEHLPPEERIAFTLKYVEGMTLEELATAMRCSTGTVKRRLRRARDRFDRLARREPALAAMFPSPEESSS
ncbi:MAG: sigma-70 family RNA polymerase sigma factor [Myxococcota bacterium]